ncbi:CDP-2,3-bis-(O-geranylgeranyl)-sn-glycerol synthase [Candidatus Micrarchaeota archaeon]|nr:CDP-2,3-bis-(O-geranylgeranyl)-sn-glycerol synthase [Candidatus Micrarchaeota archaeon]
MDSGFFINLVIFVLPAYIANALPVLLGGGIAMDFGRKFSDGKRILGNGKTIMGFLGGVVSGICAGGVISYYYLLPFFPDVKTQFICFAFMSLGTMIGDALGSFMKRRMGMDDGKPFVLDQLMFLAVALVFAMPFVSLEVYDIVPLIFLFAMTYFLHLGSNSIANRLGWKKVPW